MIYLASEIKDETSVSQQQTGLSNAQYFGFYNLVSPRATYYNGASYFVGQGISSENWSPKIIKLTDSTFEYAFVGDIDNFDSLIHNHPAVLVIGGYIYVVVCNGHNYGIKIFKSNSQESVTDGFTLHHELPDNDYNYVHTIYKDNRLILHTRSGSSVPKFSSKVLYSDENDFTTWTEKEVSNTDYDNTTVRHYPFKITHYGDNDWTYFAVVFRYDGYVPQSFYAHVVYKTQDYSTYYNLDETFSKNVNASNYITHQEFQQYFTVAGSQYDPFATHTDGANYIVLNDVVYGGYYDGSGFSLLRNSRGTQITKKYAASALNTTTVTYINGLKLYYNGTNIVLVASDTPSTAPFISSNIISTCDFNLENQQAVKQMPNNMVFAIMPYNLENVVNNFSAVSSDGFQDGATIGLVNYTYINKETITIDLDITPPNSVNDLAVDSNTGSSIVIDWTAPIAGTYPINRYQVYVDGVLHGYSYGLNYEFTDLTNGQDYSVHIYAEDLNGNLSERSNIINFTSNLIDVLTKIISYWNFDTDSTDQIGSNDGSDTSISYVSGKVGNCADFTASTGANISVTDTNQFTFGDGVSDSPFSISLGVNFNSVTGAIFVCKERTQREYDLLYNGSVLRFRLYSNTSGSIDIRKDYTWTPSTSTWYHVVATYDGSGSTTGLNIYLDGSSVGTTGSSGTYVAMNDTSEPLLFGKFPTTTSLSLNGYLDEVAIYNSELTPDEVTYLYDKFTAGQALNS